MSAAVKSHSDTQFKGFLFFIDGDEARLKKLAKEEKADNIALGVFGSDHEGMKLYKINPKAKSTVLLYKRRLVTSKIVDYNAKRDQKALVQQINAISK